MAVDEPQSAEPSAVLVAGIDIGSTGVKILVIDSAGNDLVTEQVPTPWVAGDSGTTQMDPHDLQDSISELLEKASGALTERTDSQVRAIALAGMGETGVLIDDSGTAVAPAFAWFDPRGREQADSFNTTIRREFAGRTGLPLGAQVSVSKLAYLQETGTRLRGLRWLNIPEYVALFMGGDIAVEYSLTSRTGLLDQDSGKPWQEMFSELDIDESFLPPLQHAGDSWGMTSSSLPHAFAGAKLTVAGHDHLVAAEASGTLRADHYYDSLGTAEVLLRVLEKPLGFASRERLVGRLINDVRHIVPGKHVLVAGVKSGLLLRRALLMSGVQDRAGRDALDAEVMALPFDGTLVPGSIDVRGARNDDGVLSLMIRADGVTRAELFGAVLRHSNDEIQILIDAINRELPPAHSTTMTGGWTRMDSVRRARERILPNLTIAPHEQETAFGAALIASRLLEASSPAHEHAHNRSKERS